MNKLVLHHLGSDWLTENMSLAPAILVHYRKNTHKAYSDQSISYVVVEWLTILLRIREVPDSNLGPETNYPD
jgi:hypothetical protein